MWRSIALWAGAGGIGAGIVGLGVWLLSGMPNAELAPFLLSSWMGLWVYTATVGQRCCPRTLGDDK
jgi:hypothetical protein